MKPKLVQCFNHKNQPGGTNDPITFTLNTEDIQNIINSEVKYDMSRTILTKVFNELMKKKEMNI